MNFHTTLWLFCSMDWFDAVCAVRGYHQYRTVWAPEVGEILSVRRENTRQITRNYEYKFAIGVLKSSGQLVGHLPKEISKSCWKFLNSGGVLQVEITDSHYHPSPLTQGGLEIYCTLLSFGTEDQLGDLHSGISELLAANYSPKALELRRKKTEANKKRKEKK